MGKNLGNESHLVLNTSETSHMLCLSFPPLEGDVPGHAGVLTSRKSLSVPTSLSDYQLTPMFGSLEGTFLSVSLPSLCCGSQAGGGEWRK